MTKPILLATGMFRSGTTMLARLMNAHPDIVFASDPYFQVFRSLRNAIQAEVLGDMQDEGAPLDDYLFDDTRQAVFEAIQKADLSVSTGGVDLPGLQRRVADFARPYSPLIEPHLGELTGTDFSQVFTAGLNLIEKAYGTDGATAVGFKETWIDEFAPAFLRSFPSARIIHLIRDPRAVCASNHGSDEKYTWLFLIRQWRKLAALGLSYESDPEFAGRVLVVRFEDLVGRPQETIERICGFAGVDLHDDMLDPASFTDGAGAPWTQNSTFEGKRQFNAKAIDRWREKLRAEEIGLIEKLCWPEMAWAGYSLADLNDRFLVAADALEPLIVDQREIAEWLCPHVVLTREGNRREMAMEVFRQQALRGLVEVRPGDKGRLALSEQIFDQLSDVMRKG